MTHLQCTKCLSAKLIEEFSDDSRSSRGKNSWCKTCVADNSRVWYRTKCKTKDLNRAAISLATLRDCTSCGLTKELSEYYRAPKALAGRMRRCKKCVIAKRAAHYAANTTAIKTYARNYDLKNPGKIRAFRAARKKAVRRATPSWLTAIHRAQLQEQYEIALAVTTQTGIAHEVDHVYPLQGRTSCGLHVPWNLQVIPAKDNNAKRNSLPIGI